MKNSTTGFTLQKLICDTYNIVPNSIEGINKIKGGYDPLLVKNMQPLVKKIFESLKFKPIQCTTLEKTSDNKRVPYNFILSNNSTLSIRTNINGNKVSPREVGQAGYSKLNEYFGNIYGKEIKTQDDIKHLIIENIDLCLPIFIENFLDADNIVWVYIDNGEYKYCIIDGDSGIDIDYKPKNFTFTRDFDEWKESTTLKYKGEAIAEIQVHKDRTFKFRFNMDKLLKLLISKKNNTETFGITAEKTICDIFNLDYPPHFEGRFNINLQYELDDVIRDAFMHIPSAVQHSGNDKGKRGKQSKCSYDFILKDNKTLSLKTNVGKMVCPPEVGQPNDKTCYLYFGQLIEEDHIDKNIFKKMVLENIDKMLPIYINHMFDSDYLLWVFASYGDITNYGSSYGYEIYTKNTGVNFKWDINKISFSKKTIEDWNESNTLYYDGVSIGEFQVHNNRNCFKFRFNFRNLFKVLK